MFWASPDVFSRLNNWGKQRYFRWIEHRLPLQESVTLNHSRIVIMPSQQGLLLLVISIFVLLLAINFESALNYALAFWLMSMLWVAVYMTYRNLSGLRISAQGGTLVQVGDITEVNLGFSSAKNSDRGTLELISKEWGTVQVNMNGKEAMVTLPLMTHNRGLIRPPRFRLESRFPFGLVVAWSHLLIDSKGWAYPEPRQVPRKGLTGDSDDDGLVNDHFIRQGSEDFHSIKPYQPGDSIRRLHWPGFSRDQLMVKTFSDYQATDEWIEWAHFEGLPDEVKLSAIAYYSQAFFDKDKPFGVRLPGVELMPEKGMEHLVRVRRVLAEYGYDG